jgi:hypothetical protein
MKKRSSPLLSGKIYHNPAEEHRGTGCAKARISMEHLAKITSCLRALAVRYPYISRQKWKSQKKKSLARS